ncbi:MAG: MFS transporter [Rhodospirillaceae bacterium]|nr:MFS transporter [Rhodospirillaceae bacterium]
MPQAPQPHAPSEETPGNPTKTVNSPDKQRAERQSIFAVWATLRLQTFRAFWIAGLFSLIGTWMQGIGSAWLMTDLSDSPLLVALVQSAQMIPSLFLAFIAGSLADMIDRRRYMIIVTWWMISVTLSMAGLSHLGMVTPTLLIVLTLLLGTGGACLMPAMSATLQDIVPRSEVVNAVTLNSLSMNISRLIGPALAGLLIGWAGVAPAFVVNALSYFVFMVVVYRWDGPPLRPQQKQSIWSNMAAGISYVRRAQRFQAVLIRGSVHFFCASALMALLPLLAREELGVGPEEFGTLMGAIGVGAILTALFIAPALNARYSRDTIVFWASLIIAASLYGVGVVRDPLLFAGVLFFYGGAWMICMLSFQVAAQMVLPFWVRGRGLSMSMMSFTAGMVGGGILWGTLAKFTSMEIAFDVAAVTMIVGTFATVRFLISSNETEDA